MLTPSTDPITMLLLGGAITALFLVGAEAEYITGTITRVRKVAKVKPEMIAEATGARVVPAPVTDAGELVYQTQLYQLDPAAVDGDQADLAADRGFTEGLDWHGSAR